MRKGHMLGLIVAVVAALAISVTAMAHSQKASFELNGFLGFVGISQDVLNPTVVDSNFKFGDDGQPESIVIKTRNEMVVGVLGAPNNCEGEACEEIAEALTGALLTSLHYSKAELTVTDVGLRGYTLPMPPPFGATELVAEVVSGDIEGRLKGRVRIPTSMGLLYGKTDLDIEGTATYACFSRFLSPLGNDQILPGPLHPCAAGEGQLLPIELDVIDTGSIDIKKQIIESEKGIGLVSSVIKIDGDLTVVVQTQVDLDLLVRGDASAFSVTGGLQIAKAKGELDLH